MCGITGYIGRSKHPEVSHALLTNLFRRIEERGTDAAGFWGTEEGDGQILYHKEQGRASDFVKKSIWQNTKDINTNLMICHARGASQGVGTPYTNMNNHPFVSTDRTIGLVHNGRIPDVEYDALTKKYEVKSKCDSEILLRIFEANEETKGDNFEEYNKDADWQIAHRLRSIRNIWSQIVKGHMAVSVGERITKDHRRLWLFRNRHRSLWLIDMRKYLGQVFFCSTPEIWQSAAASCREVRPFIRKKIKLIELPPEEIWVLRVSTQNPVVENSMVRKFDVSPQGFQSFDYNGPVIGIPKNKPVAAVYTKLDDDDSVDRDTNTSTTYVSGKSVNTSEATVKKNQPVSTSPSTSGPIQTCHRVATPPNTGTETIPMRSPQSGSGSSGTGAGKGTTFASTYKGHTSIIDRSPPNSSPHRPPTIGSRSLNIPMVKGSDDPLEGRPSLLQAAKQLEDKRVAKEVVSGAREVGVLFEDSVGAKSSDVQDFDKFTQGAVITDKFKSQDMIDKVKELRDVLEEIETIALNKRMEGSLTFNAFGELMTSLEQVGLDLKGTLQILSS